MSEKTGMQSSLGCWSKDIMAQSWAGREAEGWLSAEDLEVESQVSSFLKRGRLIPNNRYLWLPRFPPPCQHPACSKSGVANRCLRPARAFPPGPSAPSDPTATPPDRSRSRYLE